MLDLLHLEIFSLAFNVATFLSVGLVFLWFVIHSRRWEAAYQARKIEQHEHRLDLLMTLVERLEKNHHDLMVSSSDVDTSILSQLKRMTDRLDRLQCPQRDPGCPFNQSIGREIWTMEQREEYRKEREKSGT